MNLKHVLHNGICLENCPKNSKKTMDRGKATCKLDCSGRFEIKSKQDLYPLRDCTIIKGSLIINLEHVKGM